MRLDGTACWRGVQLDERPDSELLGGQATCSAMPLVWAHAEYVKLRRSLQDGVVFDMPTQTVQRYQVDRVTSPFTVWRFNHKCRTIRAGTTLRIELTAPATIHWSINGWQAVQDVATHDTGLGLHVADLKLATLAQADEIVFTFLWTEDDR